MKPSLIDTINNGEFRDSFTKKIINGKNTRKSLLFGDAPRPSQIKRLDNGTGPDLFYWFWYKFRTNLIHWIAPIALIGGFIVPSMTCKEGNERNCFLLYGGSLSLISCLFVIFSYIHILPWRRHPSTLILQRTITSLFFSIVVILDSLPNSYTKDGPHSRNCQVMSFLTQFSLFSGEGWLLTVSLDLVTSMTNPFSSYKVNLQQYHTFVWVSALISAIALILYSPCQGFLTEGFCWMDNIDNENVKSDPFSFCIWGFFLFWAILFYLIALSVIYYAWQRLSKGLESTFATRGSIMKDTFLVVLVYTLFNFILAIIYMLLVNLSADHDEHQYSIILSLFAYCVGCRGYVDAAIWFFLHDFNRETKQIKSNMIVSWIENLCIRKKDKTTEDNNHTAITNNSIASHIDPENLKEPLIDEIINHPDDNSTVNGEEEIDFNSNDIDLNPQLNVALRREVLHFVREGIKESVSRWTAKATKVRNTSLTPNNPPSPGLKSNSHSSRSASAQDPNMVNLAMNKSFLKRTNTNTSDFGFDSNSFVFGNSSSHRQSMNQSVTRTLSAIIGIHRPGEYGTDMTGFNNYLDEVGASLGVPGQLIDVAPEEVVFDLDDRHRFRDFRPATFHSLRKLSDISNEWYIEQLSKIPKEQLTEGASNAFLFFSGELVVKTVTPYEAGTLLKILDQYTEHLKKCPSSLLVRFLGLHALTFYGREFTFIVMKNIFQTKEVINERYDIKGSWINRNANVATPGTRTLCRHCSELFTVGEGDRCPEVVGLHEPNIVFKDNDLITKIRLFPDDAYSVIDALNRDSDALCEMGIMDYSLLVGVSNQQYDIDMASHRKQQQIVTRKESRSHRPSLSLSRTTTNDFSSIPSGSFCNTNTVSFSNNLADKSSFSGPWNSGNNEPLDRDTECTVNSDGVEEPSKTCYSARAVIAPFEYHLGVVDILQTWSLKKRLENFYRVYIQLKTGDGISCIAPAPYKIRFQRKVSIFIFIYKYL
jgi:hypothetical protein